MTEEIIAFKGEVMLLSWAESHKGGRTGVFLFDDENQEHPLKKFTTKKGKRAGQRFMCVLVELADDDTPVKQEKKGGSLSQSAAQMCERETYQDFLHHEYPGEWQEVDEAWNGPPEMRRPGERIGNADIAAKVTRGLCNIASRAELDHNQEAAKRFRELMHEYHDWCQMR